MDYNAHRVKKLFRFVKSIEKKPTGVEGYL